MLVVDQIHRFELVDIGDGSVLCAPVAGTPSSVGNTQLDRYVERGTINPGLSAGNDRDVELS